MSPRRVGHPFDSRATLTGEDLLAASSSATGGEAAGTEGPRDPNGELAGGWCCCCSCSCSGLCRGLGPAACGGVEGLGSLKLVKMA